MTELQKLEREIKTLPASDKRQFSISLAAITHAMHMLSPAATGLLLAYIIATAKAVAKEQ